MIKKLVIALILLTLTACSSMYPKETLTNDKDSDSVKIATEYKTQQIPPLQICESISAPTDPESYLDVWQRVSQQPSLLIVDNRRVRAQKSWYVNHPKYLTRVSKRAAPYLYFIVDELEKRNMPLELALLPIVESAYDPFAYSHGRASGMWQFIPGTGKGYGLEQNWWYDGRRDIFLSTHAALDYLSYLHKRFQGDWLLALAAYNSGQGNVSKAIRKNKKQNKPTDFWSLKLPKETKAYVPKLLALADILRTRRQANIPWSTVSNHPYFMRVKTEIQIDLGLAADLSEQSMQDFYTLNPAFNHWATPPKGPHYLLIPINKVDIFKQNLKGIPKKERIAFRRYIIKQGDSLSTIAKRFFTSVALLKTSNKLPKNNIRAGKSLLIPVASKRREAYTKSNLQRLKRKQNSKRNGTKRFVTVAKGDSFWLISHRNKVNLRSLAAWNNMAPNDPLKIGQKLVLWTKTPSIKRTAMNSLQKTRKIRYRVRNGDSFARIADKFNVSLSKIKNWNKTLSDKKYLQPGQSLLLFVDVTKQF